MVESDGMGPAWRSAESELAASQTTRHRAANHANS
jgi:hypothetical protein